MKESPAPTVSATVTSVVGKDLVSPAHHTSTPSGPRVIITRLGPRPAHRSTASSGVSPWSHRDVLVRGLDDVGQADEVLDDGGRDGRFPMRLGRAFGS
jgi:hypothetical protein